MRHPVIQLAFAFLLPIHLSFFIQFINISLLLGIEFVY